MLFCLMMLLLLLTNPNNYAFDLNSEFLQAVTNGTLTLNQLKLFKARGIDIHQNRGFPLQIACRKRHFTTVRIILENEPCIFPQECLCAAAYGGDLRIIQSFLFCGANINATTGIDTDEYVLWHAVRGGHHKAVQFILQKGADLHAPDVIVRRVGPNVSLLEHATIHGYYKTVQVLLDWSEKQDIGLYPNILLQHILDTAIEAHHLIIEEETDHNCCSYICCHTTKRLLNVRKALRYINKYQQKYYKVI